MLIYDNCTMTGKLDAVGGDGGVTFDSGVNPFGVRKVYIETGVYQTYSDRQQTIKRIFLEFHHPASPGGESTKVPSFLGYGADQGTENRTETFELYPDDYIVEVNIWSDGELVNAVQFHTKGGIVSPIFGIPAPDNSAMSKFKGKEGEHLVGIHGGFGDVLHKLGCTFSGLSRTPNMIGGGTITSSQDASTVVSTIDDAGTASSQDISGDLSLINLDAKVA